MGSLCNSCSNSPGVTLWAARCLVGGQALGVAVVLIELDSAGHFSDRIRCTYAVNRLLAPCCWPPYRPARRRPGALRDALSLRIRGSGVRRQVAVRRNHQAGAESQGLSGFSHRSSGKRRKSWSVDASRAPCSIASAARTASVTNGPVAPWSLTSFSRISA